MASRTCKQCEASKDLDCFEITTKDGKCRRAVCRVCYAALKASRCIKARAGHKPDEVAKPAACAECGLGPDAVDYQWRADTVSGGWRPICNACTNRKGYSQAYRIRQLAEDADGYRARKAATHLVWAHANPQKVLEQALKTRADPERRFLALTSYLRSRHGADNIDSVLDMADAVAMQELMQEPCEYCSFAPRPGEPLNGLDRVNPTGKYCAANTVSCCGPCNNMKCIMSTAEFLMAVRRVAAAHPGAGSQALPRPTVLGGTAERRAATKDKADELPASLRVDLMSRPCYLCNKGPSFGVDRVDSARGYVEDNCRPCCSTCNYMKKDWPLDVFLAHNARVYEHTKQWVLQDARLTLKTNALERKPVSPCLGSGGSSIVFPCARVAAAMLGLGVDTVANAIRKGTLYRGFRWHHVPPAAYHAQELSYDAVQALLAKLHRARV